MNKSYKTREQLLDELEELRSRVREAEETLRAIVSGEVDGLVVSTAEGDRVFTLSGADLPYRVMVETMNEGAVTLGSDGTILFCNQRFADIVKGPLEKVTGSSIYRYISSIDLQLFKALFERGLKGNSKAELNLQTGGENSAPVIISISALEHTDMHDSVCMVITDLTEQKRNEKILAEEKLTTQILQQASEIFVLCDHQGRIIRASQSTERLFGRSPIFREFDEAFHLLYPDGTPFVLLSAMTDNVLQRVEVTFKHGKNEFLSFLLSANQLITHKGVLGIIVVIVDITLRKRAEKALQNAYDEMDLRVKERTEELKGVVETLQNEMSERKHAEEKLKATNALLSLFSRKPSRKDYLDAVVDLIHSWSGCGCVGIRILDEKGFIPYESYLGFSREFWESENRLSLEHDQCVCIRVITGNPDPQDASVMTPGGSFRCDDTLAFVGRFSAEGKTRFRGVCIQNGFLSLSIVPVRYGNKILGSIQLADEEREKISLPFIEFLESMSPLIGEAINRFNLKDELRDSENRLRFLSSQLLTVLEDERKRISAELHDDIAAKLAGIKFSLEKKLIQVDKANDEANQSSIKDIISMVLDTIVSTRRIMVNLRPAMIDDLGILATLNWYCREFEQIFTGIKVEKQIRIEEIEIPDYLKIVIFRIVQEAMNNIAKHSGANHVSLVLEKINDFLALSIEDNGQGFDVENKTLKMAEMIQGFGMVNMKERARFSGGDFSINSLKEKGTLLKVTWPLKPIKMTYNLRIEPS